MSARVPALAALVVAAAAAGCSDGPSARDQIEEGAAGLLNLTVQVRDAELLPIADARVHWMPDGHNVTTGPLGDVLVADVAPGPYTVTAAQDGYYPKTENVTVGSQDATVRIVLTQVPAPEAHYSVDTGGGYCMVIDGDQEPPSCVSLLFAAGPVSVINISAHGLDALGVAFVWEATTDATLRFRFDVQANVSARNWSHQDVVEGTTGVYWTFGAHDLPPVEENDTLHLTFTPYPVDAPSGPTWADQHYRIEWAARFLPTDS